MTPEQIIDSFGRARVLLTEFLQNEGRRLPGPPFNFVLEAGTRLEQSEYLLRSFRRTEIDHTNHFHNTPRPQGQGPDAEAWFTRLNELELQIRLYGEAFYYFAWRAKQALAKVQEFDLAFNAVGVRNVRHRMIEHPDKSGGIMVLSWRFDCPEGLVLAPPADVNTVGLDPGLYPNAREFIGNLLLKLASLARGVR